MVPRWSVHPFHSFSLSHRRSRKGRTEGRKEARGAGEIHSRIVSAFGSRENDRALSSPSALRVRAEVARLPYIDLRNLARVWRGRPRRPRTCFAIVTRVMEPRISRVGWRVAGGEDFEAVNETRTTTTTLPDFLNSLPCSHIHSELRLSNGVLPG